MKKRSAKKAKDIDFEANPKSSDQRRAARIDLTWRVADMADVDAWKQKSSNSGRTPRR